MIDWPWPVVALIIWACWYGLCVAYTLATARRRHK